MTTPAEFAADAAKFKVDIANFVKKVPERASDVARAVTLEMARSLVQMSPVGDPGLWAWPTRHDKGYVGGHFRANWQFGVDGAPSGVVDGEGSPLGTLEAAISSSEPMGHTLYLTNCVEYAYQLEYGWSKQAPAGMVRVTVERFTSFVEAAAAAGPAK